MNNAPTPPAGLRSLRDLAQVMRSKRAGPTQLTIDIFLRVAAACAVARTVAAKFRPNLARPACSARTTTGGTLAFVFPPGASERDACRADPFVLYRVLHDAPLESLFQVDAIEINGASDH